MNRRAALAAAALAVVALGAVTAASFFEARALVRHRGTKPPVTPADSELAFDTVPFRATDGTVLEGWWIRPRDGARRPDLATVVLCHPEDEGRGPSGKAAMLGPATALSRAGFIVLAFDFRSYGGSQGSLTTGGYRELGDLQGALTLARARSLGAKVVIVGEGMGGTVALAAKGADPSIAAVVAIAPYPGWDDALLARAPRGTGDALLRAFAPPPLTKLWLPSNLPAGYQGGELGLYGIASDTTVTIVPAGRALRGDALDRLLLETIERRLQ